MDYRYIKHLLECYWQCETTLQEEEILRAFFAGDDVPEELRKYRALFLFEQEKAKPLGSAFDEKVFKAIGETTRVKARVITLKQRFMPLFKAAAVVAVFLTLGNAARFALQSNADGDEINYADYKDTYQDPAVAYDNVESALQLISEGISQASQADSLLARPVTEADSLRKE